MNANGLRVLLLLASAQSANGDETVFRGTLGERINVLVSIDVSAKTHLGVIHYDSSGEDGLSLVGSGDGRGGFEWAENLDARGSSETRQVGTFKGTLETSGTRARGTWIQAGGRKTLPFELNRVAVIKSLESPDVDADVDYPQFDAPHYRQLNERLTADAQRDLDEQIKSIREMHADLKDLGPDDQGRLGSSNTCTVESVEFDLVSLGCSQYEYSGGAHGNTNLTTRNFLINRDGAVTSIGLRDVVKSSPEALAALSNQLVEALKIQGASSVVRGDIKDFKFDLDSDELSFSIIPAGLAFHFSPYSVGAYVEGSYRVVLPNRNLKELVRKDGPLGVRIAGR